MWLEFQDQLEPKNGRTVLVTTSIFQATLSTVEIFELHGENLSWIVLNQLISPYFSWRNVCLLLVPWCEVSEELEEEMSLTFLPTATATEIDCWYLRRTAQTYTSLTRFDKVIGWFPYLAVSREVRMSELFACVVYIGSMFVLKISLQACNFPPY